MKKILLLVSLSASVASAEASLIFDNMTGVSGYMYTGGTPRSLEGMGVNLGGTGLAGTQVTGMDLSYISVAAATYRDVQVDVSFFGVVTGATTTSATTQAFSNLLASYSFDVGPLTTAATTTYVYGTTAGTTGAIPFGAGFSIPSDAGQLGVQMLIRGDTGNGLVADDNLTPALRTNVPWAAGTPAVNGMIGSFYRNASQPTPFGSSTSLLGSDYRVLTNSTGIGLAMRLYTAPQAVPEPGAWAALGLGALAVLQRRKNA